MYGGGGWIDCVLVVGGRVARKAPPVLIFVSQQYEIELCKI
jgi:hypothetical protein